MQRTIHITLALSDDTVRKMAELAGGQDVVDKYVNRLIQKLHAKLKGHGGVVDIEQAVLEIHKLVENEGMYKREILDLRQKLRQAQAIKYELMVQDSWGNHQTQQRTTLVLH